MPETFWTNTIWYLLLLLSSLAAVAAALAKSRDRRFTFAFTMAVLGVVFFCEYVIVAWLDAYEYSPKVVADRFQDISFGNMFSQISIATTSVLLIERHLKFRWFLLAAAAYFAIELAFISMGIYRVHWYRPWFTPVILTPLFLLMKRWYYAVKARRGGPMQYAAVYFASTAAFQQLVTLPLKLLSLQLLRPGLFRDPSRDHLAIGFLYAFCLLNSLILIVRWKAHWVCKMLLCAVLCIVQFALRRIGFVIIPRGWFLAVTTFLVLGGYGIVWFMDRSLGKPSGGYPALPADGR